MYTYSAFGLTLALPLPCPALPPAPPTAEPDVRVVYGPVPRDLDDAVVVDGPHQFAAERFLLKAGQPCGRFLVEGGRTITIWRTAEATDERVCFHLLDLPLVMLLVQRGLLVLHANAVVTPHGAAAVAGESGAGKSTLLALLLERGHAMLADDVTAVQLDGQRAPWVWPGIPHYHLLDDTADRLGQARDGLPRFRWRVLKTTVTAHERLAEQPAELRVLVALSVDDGEEMRITRLSGVDKLDAIRAHVYGVESLLDPTRYFDSLTALAARVAVYRVQRPRAHWTAPDLARFVETAVAAAAGSAAL